MVNNKEIRNIIINTRNFANRTIQNMPFMNREEKENFNRIQNELNMEITAIESDIDTIIGRIVSYQNMQYNLNSLFEKQEFDLADKLKSVKWKQTNLNNKEFCRKAEKYFNHEGILMDNGKTFNKKTIRRVERKIAELKNMLYKLDKTNNVGNAIRWCKDCRKRLEKFEKKVNKTFEDYTRQKSGIEGEEIVENCIRKLGYRYLSNLNLKGYGKQFENDLIVLRPDGIYVLEVKNDHNAVIAIDDKENSLIRSDKEKSGNRKPVEQCKKNVSLLISFLNEFNRNIAALYVKGIVVIANESSRIENESDFPVLYVNELEDYFNSINDKNVIGKDIDQLAALLNGCKEKTSKYKHEYIRMKNNPLERFEASLDEVLKSVKDNAIQIKDGEYNKVQVSKEIETVTESFLEPAERQLLIN